MLSFEGIVTPVWVDGRWTDDGDAGESNDNRGGHRQGIVVEVPCRGQSVGSAVRTAEGNSLRKLVEAGIRPWRSVRDAKQKIEATLGLLVSKVINSLYGIPQRVILARLLPSNYSTQITPLDLPAALISVTR